MISDNTYKIQFAVNVGQFAVNVGQFAVNVGRERRCALSPPSPYPRQPSDRPPPSSPPPRVKYELGRNMGGDGSAPGGSRLRDATCLTATPSAAGRTPPPTCTVNSRLLDLYRECVDSGSWARVLYDARGGMEKIIFICKIEPAPAPAAAAPPHKHGRPASARRRARDKRRREAWAERRRNRSQPRPHTPPMEDDNTPKPASAGISITSAATSPSAQALQSQPASSPPIVSPPPIGSPPPIVSPQPAPPPRKRVKTFSEATRSSSRAAVQARKRQIPQIDGCCSPPSPPLLPSPSTPCQPAIEFEDEPPLQSETSSALLTLQAPAPPQVLLLRRAPLQLVTAPGIRLPSPSAAQPAETSSSSRSGYTLVMIWCPFCKKNLIDNLDFECYMCKEIRYYLSLQYEDE